MMLQIPMTLNSKKLSINMILVLNLVYRFIVFSGRESYFSPDAQFGGG